MVVSIDGIAVAHSSINVADLHPELRRRVRRVVNSKRLGGLIRVSSGARTYAQQAHLYRTLPRGRAANPNYYNTATGRRGSKHQVQSRSYKVGGGFESGPYAYAVDVGFYGPPQWSRLRNVAETKGLHLTVFRPYEPWHFELDPAKPPHRIPIEFPRGRPLLWSGMSKPRRKITKALQLFLIRRGVGPAVGGADGLFGPATTTAVRHYQRSKRLHPDGTVGPLTWAQIDRDNS